MESPSITVEHRIEPWPDAPGHPGKLPPAALSFTMSGDALQSTQVVRQWVSDGDSWYSDWPGESGAERCCSHLCSLGELVGDGYEVWGERMGLDQGDQLLCHLGGDGNWIVPPGDGLDGQLSRAMVMAMRELVLMERPKTLADGEVAALPGPPSDADPWGELAQRSWHVRVGDQVLRALEHPPLRDFETAGLRARKLELHLVRGSAPDAPGHLLWTDDQFRIFPANAIPGLDEPRPASCFGPTLELLLEELRHTPWTRDVETW